MPTSRPPSPGAPFRADLEALRGLAVLLVVAYHAGVPALSGGFVGVDVFFVLSGYFMTRLLVREYASAGTVDLPAFYGRRALRLLPPLLLVVVATLAAAWLLFAPIDRAAVAETARHVATGTSNTFFARESVNYFSSTDSPFLHTWSLAVELQLSLFGPLLFLALATLGAWTGAWRGSGGVSEESARRMAGLLRGVGLGLVATAAVSFAVAVRLTDVAPSWAFFGAPARAWEFAVGGLLALALPAGAARAAGQGRGRGAGWWLQAGGVAAIVAAAIAYDRITPYPGTAALLPVLGAAAIVAGGNGGSGVLAGDGAALRALRWFGGVSYAWYLWHWPMVVTGAVLSPAVGVWGRLAWSAAALQPAWLTLRWVERPSRAAGRDGAGQGIRWPAAAMAGCVVVILGAVALRGAAERGTADPVQRALAAAREDRMRHDCWAGSGVTAPPDAATDGCVFGDPRAATTVALFGDSHAEHWLGALDRLGRERGWRVLLFVKGGCPVPDAPELLRWRSGRRGSECAAYREAVVRRLIALRPAMVVLGSWDEYVRRDPPVGSNRPQDGRVSAAAWERGLRRTYGRLGAAGVPVVAIRGIPAPGFDVPGCLSRRAAGLPRGSSCAYAREVALHVAARAAQQGAARDAARRGLPVRVVDMTDRICAGARCGVVQGGVVLFTDDNHLTASFARAAAPALGARLDGAARSLGVRLP